MTLTLTMGGAAANASASAPERPGVFRLNVTPTKVGSARITLNVEAVNGQEHFVLDNVPVYADVRAALASEAPEEAGLITFPKEQSWEREFATALVTVYFPGAGNILTVPATALVRNGEVTRVYVQRTPERFEWRPVQTRRTIGNAIEITNGLRAGERIVILGADKMPKPN